MNVFPLKCKPESLSGQKEPQEIWGCVHISIGKNKICRRVPWSVQCCLWITQGQAEGNCSDCCYYWESTPKTGIWESRFLYLADIDATNYFWAACKWHATVIHITKHFVSSYSWYDRGESYFTGASQNQLYPVMQDFFSNYWQEPCGLSYW